MDKLQKDKLEKRRKETSLKAMYFNRFLLIRYITAGMFFANVYWFISLMISRSIMSLVPGINLVVIVMATFEQFAMVSAPINDAKKSTFAYRYLLVASTLIGMNAFTPLFNKLFPFLQNSLKSSYLILGINVIGIILCMTSIMRLEKIKNCQDKQFKNIKRYEQAIK